MESEEDVRATVLGLTGDYEVSDVGARNKLRSLQEQYIVLTRVIFPSMQGFEQKRSSTC